MFTKNYLYSIEQAQVDVADEAEQDVVVRVYCYHMQSQQVPGDQIDVLRWSEPVAVCVQCTLPATPWCSRRLRARRARRTSRRARRSSSSSKCACA